MTRMLRLVICALSILQFECNSNSEFDDLTDYEWKYASGLNVGDWLTFQDGRFQLKYDTIFLRDSAVAKVTGFERRVISNDAALEISSFDGTRGKYISK